MEKGERQPGGSTPFTQDEPREPLSSLLKTPRLHLTPVVQSDWEKYHPILSDPATGYRSNLPRKPTPKRTQGVVGWMVRNINSGKGFAWMIWDSNSTLVGCIRINAIDHEQSSAVIGYEIGSAYWGNGYATEALLAVTKHAHSQMDIFRLEAWTLEGNPQSDRVLLKAGFSYEGTQRKKMLLYGERLDMRMFGRIVSDPV